MDRIGKEVSEDRKMVRDILPILLDVKYYYNDPVHSSLTYLNSRSGRISSKILFS